MERYCRNIVVRCDVFHSEVVKRPVASFERLVPDALDFAEAETRRALDNGLADLGTTFEIHDVEHLQMGDMTKTARDLRAVHAEYYERGGVS